ncbi:PliI family lysozyme inhibitor of I-type lysozyme [Pseudomonas lundensis]|uniref:PliI family lysozyme inhibitor of I-type lysozyme n=1 Tax=Serratia proteamaculans TaxID=28151 RepID=UPI002981732D|nr:PliI family lysozyme inhibitor of I-type lysozyme [Serratia proteamaculans]MDW5500489.1 PliI family lysozyme inhibitor of I-type lysozyme [Serratia proteamaculans]MDW5505555.1 PliI family lysozyme inhibitor of I-type lysozyme [Pseudomonas lundensis]
MKIPTFLVLFTAAFALSPLSQAATHSQTATIQCPKGATPNSDLKQRLVKVSDKQIVIISATPCEAASTGSYSVRLYNATSAEYLTDDFVDGLMVPRDGSIISTELSADRKQLKVVIENAGSGNNSTKDYFSFQGNKIKLIKSVYP